MTDLVSQYIDGLTPQVDLELLAPELISRRAILRERIADGWDELDDADREQVRAADRALLELAPELAGYWRQDDIAYLREREKIPEAHWWWWLDRIADGDYPPELLPEAA